MLENTDTYFFLTFYLNQCTVLPENTSCTAKQHRKLPGPKLAFPSMEFIEW